MSIQTAAAMAQVMRERKRQDDKWGGPEHDDQHDIRHWYGLINECLYMPTDFALVDPVAARRYLVEIAALAVAAIESIDRKTT